MVQASGGSRRVPMYFWRSVVVSLFLVGVGLPALWPRLVVAQTAGRSSPAATRPALAPSQGTAVIAQAVRLSSNRLAAAAPSATPGYQGYVPAVFWGAANATAPTQPGATATPVTPTATPTTTPVGDAGGFFLPWTRGEDVSRTREPSVAVDASGGVHIAYLFFGQPSYTYCASGCDRPENFSSPVSLHDQASHVQLALDPQGHPRLLFLGANHADTKVGAYYYAACDSGCTNAAGWGLPTRIFGTDSGPIFNSHFFSLDPQGRPRFVHYEKASIVGGSLGDETGTYLLFCDSSCTDVANWSYELLVIAELRYPSLAITSTGLPRLAASYSDFSVDPVVEQLLYLECSDPACSAPPTVGGAFGLSTCNLCDDQKEYFRLTLTPSDLPRLAVYTGQLNDPPAVTPKTLYYLWCDTGCGDAATAAWDGYPVGVPNDVGVGVDLAMDAEGRPHMAFEDPTLGLTYAWCTSGCETANPVWQTLLADSSAALDVSEPVPPLGTCTEMHWFTGKLPSLALDSAGNPRIGFGADHLQGGCFPPPTVQQDQVNARFVSVN